MKGLLMKDLLNLKQIVRVWALLLALFIVIGFAQQSPVYISSMLTVMVLLLPVNALAYDENCKWDAYALTMPVTRRDLALSKYLLALVGAGAMALLSAVCALMMGATPDEVFSTIGLLLGSWTVHDFHHAATVVPLWRTEGTHGDDRGGAAACRVDGDVSRSVPCCPARRHRLAVPGGACAAGLLCPRVGAGVRAQGVLKP